MRSARINEQSRDQKRHLESMKNCSRYKANSRPPSAKAHKPPTKNSIDSHRRTYRDWNALKIPSKRNLFHANPTRFEGDTGWAMPPACSPNLCLPNPDGGGRAAGARQISAHRAMPGHLGHSTGGPVGAPGSPGRLDGLLSVQITATASLDQPPRAAYPFRC